MKRFKIQDTKSRTNSDSIHSNKFHSVRTSQLIQLALCQHLQNCVVTNLSVMHQRGHKLPHYFLGNVPNSVCVRDPSIWLFLGLFHTKLTKQKHKRNSVFCDKSTTCNIFATCLCFLQLNWVQSSVGKDQKASVLLQVSVPAGWCQRSVDLSPCAKDIT